MSPRVQLIRNAAGSPSYAVLPWDEYRRLAEAAGQDAEAVARLAHTEQTGSKERFPQQMVERIRAGENPVKVFREWRGLSLAQLADETGLGRNHISQLETGLRQPGSMTMTKLAKALGITIESLIEPV